MKGAVFKALVSSVALLQVVELTDATGPTNRITTPLKCLNEGISNGAKCMCWENVHGPRCIRINDRTEIHKTAEAIIRVELTIVNYVYTQELSNFTSDEYKRFEKRFNEKVISVLSGISKGVKIKELRKSNEDGTLVIHDVLIDILYNQSLPVIEQYEDKYKEVVTLLKEDKCKQDSLCIDGKTVSVTMNRPPSEQKCLNGGIYDGIKCICPEDFYGSRCQNVIEQFLIGKAVDTSVFVELTFYNKVFNQALNNKTTDEYKTFEEEFKNEMFGVYSNIPGYKGVEIIKIREGSVIVEHDVIVEIEYKEDVNVTQQYDDFIQQVAIQLMEQDCTNNSSFCIDKETLKIEGNNVPLSKEDLCKLYISAGLQDYFSPVVTTYGLTCLSHCDIKSPYAPNCNGGSCQIQNETGPQCLCPRTDLYIYMSRNCQGRMLKSGVYGGLGASIAALFIVILLLFFFLFKRQREEKLDAIAQDKAGKWHENKEDGWNIDRGITNLS